MYQGLLQTQSMISDPIHLNQDLVITGPVNTCCVSSLTVSCVQEVDVHVSHFLAGWQLRYLNYYKAPYPDAAGLATLQISESISLLPGHTYLKKK